ncbi:MAG: Wzz/FepE/Etk N-terminal domain-containing protein [Gammaproteobacteria bacterium]|nr:Wzz/FepE/Etk N-terminal domain-containing protein [Gammaproteobacteria bacterium]
MEEQEVTIQDYLAILSRRKISMLIVIMLVFIIGLVVAMAWPPTYRSAATILIKEQEIPPELVRSTVTSYAAQRIETIKQRVLTRGNLMQIIDKYELYVKDRKRFTNEEVLETMREDISIRMISAEVMDPRTGRPGVATIAFKLSYDGQHPSSTQKVAGELTSLFLAENLKTRKEKASETYLFLTDETEKLSNTVTELEKKLAEFKDEHADSLPEVATINLNMLDRVERELYQVEMDIQSREERKFYLESQLAQINPLTNMRSATGQIILDPVSRLKSLESEYASISATYSDDHPDVIKIKREIEGLRKQTGQVDVVVEKAKQLSMLRTQLSEISSDYAPDHPDVVSLNKKIQALEEQVDKSEKTPEQKIMQLQPDNPAYISVKAQLNTVLSDIKSLSKRKSKLNEKLQDYEARISRSPQVEREYLILKREHANVLQRFQDLRSRQMQAEIGQELEKDSKGESFILIDPAQLPEEPIKPNRKVIVFLAFVIAIIQEGLDASVRGVKGVSRMLSAAPLAVIPMIYNSHDYLIKRRMNRLIAVSIIGGAVFIVLLVHFMYKPLDVIWFMSIRKAENILGI